MLLRSPTKIIYFISRFVLFLGRDSYNFGIFLIFVGRGERMPHGFLPIGVNKNGHSQTHLSE